MHCSVWKMDINWTLNIKYYLNLRWFVWVRVHTVCTVSPHCVQFYKRCVTFQIVKSVHDIDSILWDLELVDQIYNFTPHEVVIVGWLKTIKHKKANLITRQDDGMLKFSETIPLPVAIDQVIFFKNLSLPLYIMCLMLPGHLSTV